MQIKHSVFLVCIWRFQHLKNMLQNTKLKQTATRFSNHSQDLYLSKSLGSSGIPLTLRLFIVKMSQTIRFYIAHWYLVKNDATLSNLTILIPINMHESY